VSSLFCIDQAIWLTIGSGGSHLPAHSLCISCPPRSRCIQLYGGPGILSKTSRLLIHCHVSGDGQVLGFLRCNRYRTVASSKAANDGWPCAFEVSRKNLFRFFLLSQYDISPRYALVWSPRLNRLWKYLFIRSGYRRSLVMATCRSGMQRKFTFFASLGLRMSIPVVQILRSRPGCPGGGCTLYKTHFTQTDRQI
jgi:hypothetical protein